MFPATERLSAPDNPSDQDLVVLLEAVATCDGEPSLVEIGSTSLTVTPAAVMSAVGSSGPPESVVRVPVVVDLHSLWANRFAFSVQVTPTGTAAALVEPLGFEEAAGLPVPDMVSPSGDTIAVGWLAPISEPVTESVHLGDVLVTVPAAAELGDGYDVCVLSVGLGLGSEELCVRAGDCATLSVCVDILVGDIYRMSTPTPMADENGDGDICDWGEYNDNELTLGDVFAVFDAWAQMNPLGCGAGSHRFYAADSYPLDSEGVVGGNGELSFGDVFTTFDRWADPQLPRPWRKACSEELPVTSVLSERVSVAGLGRAAPVAELVIADGAGQAGGTVRLPVTLEVGEGEVDRVAFAVEVAADQEETLSVVGFEPSGALGTPLTSSAPDGLAVAWLAPIAPALSGEVKLGDVVVAVEERAAAGATCRIRFVTVGGSLGQGEIAVAAGPDATVTVEPGEAHDVKIRRFQVPSKAKVGESKRLGVELENLTEHSEQIEVRLLREGGVVQTWSIELAGGERKKLTAEYTFAAQDSPSVTLAAEAVLAGDINPDDNRVTATVSVR